MTGLKLVGFAVASACFAALATLALRGVRLDDGPRDLPELAPESIDGKYGYVDRLGRIVIAPRFDGADTFSEGLAVVLDSGRFGYVDARGTMVIPPVFRVARSFHGGFGVVRQGDRWLFIDHEGRTFPCSSSSISTPLASTEQ